MYARYDVEDIEALADADLVRRFKLGSDEALSVLLRRHSDALYRFCLHLSGNREDAEDIAQETLARALTRAESLNSGASFRSWLFSIARNLTIDSFRSRKRLTPLPEIEDSSPTLLYDDGTQDRLELHEEYQTVGEALRKLAQSHQNVLWMREVQGMSYAEIAEKLDLSQSAVETLLFRARRRLRDEYRKSTTPFPALAFLGGLRGMLGRLATPLSGGLPLAAKAVLTAAVVGGAAIAAPHIVPFGHSSAAPLRVAPTSIAPLSRSSGIGTGQRTTGHGGASQRFSALQSAPRHAGSPARGSHRTLSVGQAGAHRARQAAVNGALQSPHRHGSDGAGGTHHGGQSAVTASLVGVQTGSEHGLFRAPLLLHPAPSVARPEATHSTQSGTAASASNTARSTSAAGSTGSTAGSAAKGSQSAGTSTGGATGTSVRTPAGSVKLPVRAPTVPAASSAVSSPTVSVALPKVQVTAIPVPTVKVSAPGVPSAPVVKVPTVPAVKAPTVPAVKAPTLPAVKAPTVPAVKAPTVPAVKAPTVAVARATAVPAVKVPTVPAVKAPTVPAVKAPTIPAIKAPTKTSVKLPVPTPTVLPGGIKP